MTFVYPAILSPIESGKGYEAYLPDLNIKLDGKTLYDTIVLARDLLHLTINNALTNKQDLPSPATLSPSHGEHQLVTLLEAEIKGA